MTSLIRRLALLLLLSAPASTLAETTLTLGIFAFRPKPIMEAQYRPLIEHLEAEVPETRFQLKVLTQTEMETALTRNELDLVFTNPSHFVLLRHVNRLTGAMATLVALEKGRPVSRLGGVIMVRADRNDLRDLADLKGRRIAVPGVKFLGGYQTQAYEFLQAGIDLPTDTHLNVVGSHDEVVQTVLDGRADAGFVRTGIVEAMTREGKLPPGQIKLINRQSPPGFPYLVSTRLYPEWAFAALPHVDEHIANHIARALLRIEPDSKVAIAADIHGFTVPADYLPVENLARALRLPPFEGTPEFTPEDIWARYRTSLLVGLAGGAMILLMATGLLLGNRRLRQAEAALRKSEAGLSALLDNTPYLMWLKDKESRFLAVNKAFVRSTAKGSAAEIVGKTDFDLWPKELAERYRADDMEVMSTGRQKLIEAEEVHLGRPCWMETFKTPILDEQGKLLGTAGFARDTSERREREQRRLAEEMAHRDTLVREVHHRIKNNLQSVAGLLRRELGKYVEMDPRLETAITQVYSIAVVHGLQSADPNETTLLCDTIDQICRTVRDQTRRPLAWLPGGERRQFGQIQIDRDEAVAIALVLNELLLNAVKHSPTEGPEPVVDVTAVGDDINVSVSNTVTAPPDFDFERGAGVNTGLRLVRSLLPEQGAKLSYEMDPSGRLVARLALREPVVRIKEQS